MAIQIIPTTYEEYHSAVMNSDPCVMDVNRLRKLNVGDIIGRDHNECEVLNIYVHHESGSAFMIVRHMKSGQLFEEELEYSEDVGV